MGAFSHITFAAKSDIGRKRKNNEDAFGTFPALGIYCVADGMGGGDDGEVASAATVSAVEGFVKTHPLPKNLAFPHESVIAGVRAAVNGASKWIYDRAKSRNLKGCGSTFVGVCLDPSHPGMATALHAGDSRLYRIRGRGIQQITTDHSAAELIGAKNENEINPMFRGMILRAVGIQPSVDVEATPLPLKEGDFILICSDGLSRMVPDKKIAAIVRENASLDEAASSLIAAANDAGGIDNVTVVLLKVGNLPAPLPTAEMPKVSDGADAPTCIGESDAAFVSRDSETNPSFDVVTEESDADAASFAAETATSATLTGSTGDSISGDATSEQRLTGSGWKAMQEIVSEESPKSSNLRTIVAIAAVVAVAVAAIVLFAMFGGSDKCPGGEHANPQVNPEPVKVVLDDAATKAIEDARKKAEEEARKGMAEKMAEMQRQVEEARKMAEKEKEKREAEAKRLEDERKKIEEARIRAEKEAARIAAVQKAAEEKAAKEKAEREAEAKRLEEARKTAEEAQRKAEEEAARIAAERKAAEEARKKAEEEAVRIAAERKAAEEARKKAEEEAARIAAERKAAEEKVRKYAEIKEKARPYIQGAWEYCDAGEARMALVEMKAANDIGYVLTRQEYERIRVVYDEKFNELGKRIRNKKLASDLERENFKREQDEISRLWSELKSEDTVATSPTARK